MAKPIELRFEHTLSNDDARDRMRALGEYLYNRHKIAVEWSDPTTASFEGRYLIVSIQGSMTLEQGAVQFRGEDPGMLWRKRASKYIQGKLERYLNPDEPLAELPRG